MTEPENTVFKQEHSSVLPLITTSSHNALPNISSHKKTERTGNTFPGDSELEDWNMLKSEVKSTTVEASTGTTSLHGAALPNITSHEETDDAVGIENGLRGDQEEFGKIDDDSTSSNRGTD